MPSSAVPPGERYPVLHARAGYVAGLVGLRMCRTRPLRVLDEDLRERTTTHPLNANRASVELTFPDAQSGRSAGFAAMVPGATVVL